MLPAVWEWGYPSGPEMEGYHLQIKSFMQDWEHIETLITCNFAVLETNQPLQELLQKMIKEIESMLSNQKSIEISHWWTHTRGHLWAHVPGTLNSPSHGAQGFGPCSKALQLWSVDSDQQMPQREAIFVVYETLIGLINVCHFDYACFHCFILF